VNEYNRNPKTFPNPYTCAEFVDVALRQAGAKSLSDFGVDGPSTSLDYIWGNLTLEYNAGDSLSQLDQVQPGDVIQLRDVANASGTVVPRNAPRNPASARSVGSPLGPFSSPINQHTAIVEQNLGGGLFTVLEQSSGGHGYVTEDRIDFANMTTGTIWVYQPVHK
jgi:hypothetical protein